MGKLNKSDIDKLLGKPQAKKLELTDGNNLYLIVTTSGACKFKYRIRTQNKATWVVIGDYPDISLNDARKMSLEYRALVSSGIDPNSAKRQEQAKLITMNELANRYFKERMPTVRTKENSTKQFVRAVEIDILNIIGTTLVPNVTDEIIRNKLINPKLENGSPSVARRIRNNLKLLLDYGMELGIIENNPTARIKASNIYRDKPRKRHLKMDEVRKLLNLIYSAPIKTQHKFTVHLSLMLLTRKTELLHSRWDAIDFTQKTFTIQDSKMGNQLVIPLPDQAIKIFEKLRTLSQGSKYVFIGRSGIDAPVSNTTINWVLRPINKEMFGNNKADYFTVHDLRRTGATLLSEMSYPSDYIEMALNHSKGGMKEVYQRSKFLAQRKEMLQTWANKLDELIDKDLLPYNQSFIL